MVVLVFLISNFFTNKISQGRKLSAKKIPSSSNSALTNFDCYRLKLNNLLKTLHAAAGMRTASNSRSATSHFPSNSFASWPHMPNYELQIDKGVSDLEKCMEYFVLPGRSCTLSPRVVVFYGLKYVQIKILHCLVLN